MAAAAVGCLGVSTFSKGSLAMKKFSPTTPAADRQDDKLQSTMQRGSDNADGECNDPGDDHSLDNREGTLLGKSKTPYCPDCDPALSFVFDITVSSGLACCSWRHAFIIDMP